MKSINMDFGKIFAVLIKILADQEEVEISHKLKTKEEIKETAS